MCTYVARDGLNASLNVGLNVKVYACLCPCACISISASLGTWLVGRRTQGAQGQRSNLQRRRFNTTPRWYSSERYSARDHRVQEYCARDGMAMCWGGDCFGRPDGQSCEHDVALECRVRCRRVSRSTCPFHEQREHTWHLRRTATMTPARIAREAALCSVLIPRPRTAAFDTAQQGYLEMWAMRLVFSAISALRPASSPVDF